MYKGRMSPYDENWPGALECLAVEIQLNDPRTIWAHLLREPEVRITDYIPGKHKEEMKLFLLYVNEDLFPK